MNIQSSAPTTLPHGSEESWQYVPVFIPQGKHPIRTVDMKVHSETIHRMLLHRFELTQKALFFMETIAPRTMASHIDGYTAVIGLLMDRYQLVEDALDAEIARLKHVATEHGIDTVTVYTKNFSQSFPIFTPLMARWMSLVERVDSLMVLVDALWWGAHFGPVVRSEFITKWRNVMTRFSREITHLHHRVLAYHRRTLAAAKNADSQGASPYDTLSAEDRAVVESLEAADAGTVDPTAGDDELADISGTLTSLDQSVGQAVPLESPFRQVSSGRRARKEPRETKQKKRPATPTLAPPKPPRPIAEPAPFAPESSPAPVMSE